jgi:hypothetical protein
VSRHAPASSTFVERVLDGHARADELPAEITRWEADPKLRARPLHTVLGLDANELILIANTPDALRYVLHARRFGLATPAHLSSQPRVQAYASQLASESTDPFVIAEIEAWAMNHA